MSFPNNDRLKECLVELLIVIVQFMMVKQKCFSFIGRQVREVF